MGTDTTDSHGLEEDARHKTGRRHLQSIVIPEKIYTFELYRQDRNVLPIEKAITDSRDIPVPTISLASSAKSLSGNTIESRVLSLS